jgi:hypothetical protein
LILESEFTPLSYEERKKVALLPSYGGAFSFVVPGLSKLLLGKYRGLWGVGVMWNPPLRRQSRHISFLRPDVHRLRVFRQQSDQLYLGVNLSPKEYEAFSNGKIPKGFWDEMHIWLKSYGLDISGILML